MLAIFLFFVILDFSYPISYVVNLTDYSLPITIHNNKFLFVDFYANWCDHCKEFDPYFEEAAKVLKKLDKPVVLARLDCANNRVSENKYQITKYPTLMLFARGGNVEYTGDGGVQAMVDFLEEQIVGAKYLKNMQEVMEIKNEKSKGLKVDCLDIKLKKVHIGYG